MLITEKDEQTVEFQRSSNEGERSRSTKHHEQARHPILTSQGGKNDRNETRNRARISTQGQWRPSSGADEDAIQRGEEGRRDAYLDLDRDEAGRRGGEGGGEALRGEDVAGPWKRTMGEGQRGLPFTPRPGEPSNFFFTFNLF